MPAEKAFCGTWSEILFNNDECIASVSGCVNHFINNTDKIEIIFGCCKKDYDAIITQIHIGNCVIEVIPCKNM